MSELVRRDSLSLDTSSQFVSVLDCVSGESTVSKDSSGATADGSVGASTTQMELNGSGDTQHSDSDNWAQSEVRDNSSHVVAGNETSAEHCSETISESPSAPDNDSSPSTGQSESSSRNGSAIDRNKPNAAPQSSQTAAVE